MTYTMSTIRPWHTGDRTIDNILLSGFGTNIILILGSIKRELNLFEHDETVDDLHDEHDKALAYWRQNHR
jgi:hypothetical protein